MSNACYELMIAEEAEVSMEQAFGAALNNDTIHDIWLQGSDGVRVPAVRSLLALRSKVFCKMLYGRYQEASQNVVKVGYPGAVVKAIVEYMFTNKTGIMEESTRRPNKDKDPPVFRREDFQTLLTLTAAAAFYNLPKLCNKVNDCLRRTYISKFPTLSYTIAEAYVQEQAAISGTVKQQTLGTIEILLKVCDNDLGSEMEVLSLSGLEFVLSGITNVDAWVKFRILKIWSSAFDEATLTTHADKQGLVKSLVEKHVVLYSIDRDMLLSTGLLTKEELEEACQRQQLAYPRRQREPSSRLEQFNRSVATPVWKDTFWPTLFDSKTKVLQCPALKFACRYQWTIEISNTHSIAHGILFGIMYCSGSRFRILGRKMMIRGSAYGDKLQVVMSLDLSVESESNGSLCFSSVRGDGNHPPDMSVEAENNGSLCFSSVRGNLPPDHGGISLMLNGNDGFLPCVSSPDAIEIKIISMKQLE